MRLAWATDVHLNFVTDGGADAFADAVAAADPAALLLTGDIAEAPSVARALERVAARLALPVYFVLGNHDYYRSSIAAVRAAMADLGRRVETLRYLPLSGVVALTGETALVGHDGWNDGRCGDYASSRIALNDYRYIREL